MIQDPEVQWLVPKDFSRIIVLFLRGKKREKNNNNIANFETKSELQDFFFLNRYGYWQTKFLGRRKKIIYKELYTCHAQIIKILSVSHMPIIFKHIRQITLGLKSYWWGLRETHQFSNTNNFKLGQEGILLVRRRSKREAFQLAE